MLEAQIHYTTHDCDSRDSYDKKVHNQILSYHNKPYINGKMIYFL